MGSRPSVNWWAGNLRPHESSISFIARFCELNRISSKRCIEFFGKDLWAEERVDLINGGINRLATILDEPPAVVSTVFAPRLRYVKICDSGIPWRLDRRGLRYCEHCARYGYHSSLHEISWLSVCPFHLSDLKWAPNIPRWPSSELAARMALLRSVMEESCAAWPHRARGDGRIFNKGRLATLTRWIESASKASISLCANEIWRSEPYGPLQSSQIFGQLRGIKAMPKRIEPMLSDWGKDGWHVEIRKFSQEVAAELKRIAPKFNIGLIYDFYKQIRPLSNIPPTFLIQLKNRQTELEQQHGICSCEWALRNAGPFQYWEQVSSERRPLRPFNCPFQVAIDELEFNWGSYLGVLSRRHRREETGYLILQSCETTALGLTQYTKGVVAPSPEESLFSIARNWPCCEWVQDSPLTSLLDAMVECEIELAFCALTIWLNQISRGVEPTERNDPVRCLRLRETPDGLTLVSWLPPAFSLNQRDINRRCG